MDSMDLDPRPACTLDSLPTEIVEEIALHLAYPPGASRRWLRSPGQAFKSLRATCKSLEAKTHHAFVRLGFKERTVDFSDEGLRDLMAVANTLEYALAVTKLGIVRRPGRKEIAERFRKASFERVHFERSGMGTTLLTNVLRELKNVNDIWFEPEDDMSTPSVMAENNNKFAPGSAASLFMPVLAAVQLSGIRLTTLSMTSSQQSDDYGLPCGPLCFPDITASVYQHLETLELAVHYDSTYISFFNYFLRGLPAIKNLYLALSSYASGERCLDTYLTEPSGSSLEALDLYDFNFSLTSHQHFLGFHQNTLKSLTLAVCGLSNKISVVQPCSWVDIFRELMGFPHLCYLHLTLLSQDECRVCFPTQGLIFEDELYESPDIDTEGWVYLSGLDPGEVWVDEWEHMLTRLEALIEDFHLDDGSLHSDAPTDEDTI